MTRGYFEKGGKRPIQTKGPHKLNRESLTPRELEEIARYRRAKRARASKKQSLKQTGTNLGCPKCKLAKGRQVGAANVNRQGVRQYKWRRYECPNCEHRYATYETYDRPGYNKDWSRRAKNAFAATWKIIKELENPLETKEDTHDVYAGRDTNDRGDDDK